MTNCLLAICMVAEISFGFFNAGEDDKQTITGTWEFVSAKINGEDDLQSVSMNRTQHFMGDLTFEGRYVLDGNSYLFNQGHYVMVNDTTMVTIHSDMNGQLAPFSNVYTVKIKNDTLHQYEYFIRPLECSLMPVYLDEYWVRKKDPDFY